MSTLGHKGTYAAQNGMSALPRESGHVQCNGQCPLRAIRGHLRTGDLMSGSRSLKRLVAYGYRVAPANEHAVIHPLGHKKRPIEGFLRPQRSTLCLRKTLSPGTSNMR